MTAAEVVTQALADEQERLRALPFKAPDSVMFDDFYGGKLVLARCHYSGKEPELRFKSQPSSGECKYCYLDAKGNTTEEGLLVEHARALNIYDQSERVVSALCGVLGFDEWSDASSYARAATREESARRLGQDGKLARAVSYLAEQLVRRDATQGSRAALDDLTSFKRDGRSHEHPFFTEAELYELVGKDDARSILSRVRTLATAMGGGNSG